MIPNHNSTTRNARAHSSRSTSDHVPRLTGQRGWQQMWSILNNYSRKPSRQGHIYSCRHDFFFLLLLIKKLLGKALLPNVLHHCLSFSECDVKTTTTAYYKVFRIVHHHQTQIQTLELQVQEPADPEGDTSMNITEQRKSLIAKFLIYCLLIVCYVPVCVMMTVQRISGYGSANVQSMFDFSLALVCFNSTLNPFIYCWRFHNIRSAVIETARKVFCLDEPSGQNQ